MIYVLSTDLGSVRRVALIERAQFALNTRIYQAGGFKADLGFEGSWLEWFLFETESFHGMFDCRRQQLSSRPDGISTSQRKQGDILGK